MNVDYHGQAFRLSKYHIDAIELRDINDVSFMLTDAFVTPPWRSSDGSGRAVLRRSSELKQLAALIYSDHTET